MLQLRLTQLLKQIELYILKITACFPGKPDQPSKVVEETWFNGIKICKRGLEVIIELVKPDNLFQISVIWAQKDTCNANVNPKGHWNSSKYPGGLSQLLPGLHMTNPDVVLSALVQAAIEKVPSVATSGKRPITSSGSVDASASSFESVSWSWITKQRNTIS